MTNAWTIEDSEDLYGVKKWGAGYFSIGENGNIQVAPNHRMPEITIDMAEVIEEMKAEGIQFPAVIRFHDILRSQVEILNETFRDTIEEAEYEGEYVGVYRSEERRVGKECRSRWSPYQ